MNKTINKNFHGEKYLPQFHLKQPGFTYSAYRSFSKHCERIQKFRKTGNLKHFCGDELEKAYFAYDISYSDGKD